MPISAPDATTTILHIRVEYIKKSTIVDRYRYDKRNW
jgi:hypothetical protein